MSEQDRFQRPEAERTRPVRDWTGAFRPGDAAGSRPSGDAAGSRPSGSDAGDPVEGWSRTVGHAVSLGYEVIEDQIRQGQRIAQQVGGRQYGAAEASGELQETTARFLRYSSEFAALWFDAWGRVAAQGWRGWAPPLGPDAGNGGPRPPWAAPGARGGAAAGGPGVRGPARGPAPPSTPPSVGIAVEVESRRPARVTVSLPAASDPGTLDVEGLASGGGPELVEVRFRREGEGSMATVKVRVPDDFPAGEHSWQVVERESRRAVGHLTVAVGEAREEQAAPQGTDAA